MGNRTPDSQLLRRRKKPTKILRPRGTHNIYNNLYNIVESVPRSTTVDSGTRTAMLGGTIGVRIQ